MRIFSALIMVLCSVLLSGCSEMMFVDISEPPAATDPREDIRLTGIATEMTSAGLTLQRVFGEEALYSQAKQDLTIKGIEVELLNENGQVEGITEAEMGKLYMADAPSVGRSRKDMLFQGGVHYTAPDPEDPTTVTMQLRTDTVLWSEPEKVFRSPARYEMEIFPKGKQPFRQWGKTFEATQDLTRFRVIGGVVTTDMEEDPVMTKEEFDRQFHALAQQVREGAM